MGEYIENYDRTVEEMIAKLRDDSWITELPTQNPFYTVVTCPLCSACISITKRADHIHWHQSEMAITRALLVPFDKFSEAGL